MSAQTRQNTFTVTDPVTGETLADVPSMNAAAVGAAVERLRGSQPAWAALDVRERGRRIRRWADAMWRERADLIRRIRRETGKTEGSALSEVGLIDNVVTYHVRAAPRLLRPRHLTPTFPLLHSARIAYHPYGVVGCLTPWNYPYLNLLIDALPALFAGNAVLLKPSEVAPLIALHVVEQMREAGIDTVDAVTGGAETGAAVIDAVDYLCVTGSTATGRIAAERAAARLIPCSLELGGKDAALVLDDADPDSAARWTLIGGVENAGQACVGVERVYVLADIYDRFMERLIAYAAALNCGTSDGLQIDMGSMTRQQELARAEAHIADALAKGARIAFGGTARPDRGRLCFDVTILENVDHTMDVMREETFAPIIPVMRARDEAEAIRLANDSGYGLMASVFSRDLRRAGRVAARLEAGSITINRVQLTFATPSAPMMGWKDSGIGGRGGAAGLLRFARTQSVVTERVAITPRILNQTDALTINGYRLLRRLVRWLP